MCNSCYLREREKKKEKKSGGEENQEKNGTKENNKKKIKQRKYQGEEICSLLVYLSTVQSYCQTTHVCFCGKYISDIHALFML